MRKKSGLARLVAIMQQLRGPNGCPWDKEQTLESLIPFIVEESYEVIGAIDAKSPELLKEELGDLLFQIIFICQLAREKKHFNIEDIIAASIDKMIRRHPHVFKKTKVKTSKDVLKYWARIKRKERGSRKSAGYMSDIPEHLPALLKAHKVTERASQVGFDWDNIEQVLKKVDEEMGEFKSALAQGDSEKIKEELGDIIFSLVNLGRFADINAEEALRRTIARFVTRFHYIEKKLKKKGMAINNASLSEMEKFWNEAKTVEKKLRITRS